MATLRREGNPHGLITSQEVKMRGPARPAQFTDEAALKLVVQDAATAEQWLDQKQWALNWRESDILYQSPRTVSTWEGSGTTRANVSRFTVAKHVNSLVPNVMSGIFYDDPPFVLRPRPGTTQATTRAKSIVFSALLDEIDFKTECEDGIGSQVNKGTGIWKWGCYTEKRIEKKFVRKQTPAKVPLPMGGEQEVNTAESDEFDVKEVEVTRWRPFFEFCPLGTVLVDPGWRKPNRIHKAKFVVHRQYLSAADLNRLRGREGYDIPSEEELKTLCFGGTETAVSPSTTEQSQSTNGIIHHAEGREQKTTADPLELGWKVDERWDGARVMTVLQDKVLIRNEEHGLGEIPFLSANWWNIENAGYGMGIGKLVGSDQRVDQGATNAALDMLSLGVNPNILRARSANAPTQQIRSRLGAILDVDLAPGQRSVHEALGYMEAPKIPSEVWMAIRQSNDAAESVSGADEAMMQGRLPGKGSSIGRTATGAGSIAAASASRIQGPVGKFVDNVFIPFLRHLDEMVNERMPLSEIRGILAEDAPDLEVDFDAFLNARLRYEVLAGAHLAAKKAMAQSLPWMIQILENPHMLQSLNQTGWTVDLKEIFDMVLEISEWKNNRTLIRKMTEEEQQMFKQVNSPQQIKLAGDLQQIQARGAVESQLTDQKAEARLASKLIEESLDRAGAHEERMAAQDAIAPFARGNAQYTST